MVNNGVSNFALELVFISILIKIIDRIIVEIVSIACILLLLAIGAVWPVLM